MGPEETKIVLITGIITASFLIGVIIINCQKVREKRLKIRLCNEIREPDPAQDWTSSGTINKMSLKIIKSFDSTINFYFFKIIEKWRPAAVVSFIRKINNNIKDSNKRKYLLNLLEKLVGEIIDERLVDISIEAIISHNEIAKDLIINALNQRDPDQFLIIFEKKFKAASMEARCKNIKTTTRIEAKKFNEKIIVPISELV